MSPTPLIFAAAIVSLTGLGFPKGAHVQGASSPPAANVARCEGASGFAPSYAGRRLFLYRPEWLSAQKVAIQDNEGVQTVRGIADRALARPISTPADKSRMPPSGDKRDYMSMGPYWWPDPAKRNGEPYVRRDGQVNPEREGDGFDLRRLETFSNDMEALAIAYHHLGDMRYATKAADLARAWFVDSRTRMNPNLNHAQIIPGRSSGRAEGVIDAERLLAVVEAVGLLGPSETLSQQDQNAIEQWFGELVHWMATSPIGRAERAKTNNHGILYDVMLVDFALFARMDDVAKHVVREFPERRIAAQMTDAGELPQEMERTRSWHYAHLATGGMVQMAQLAECVGVDLWRWESPTGRSIAKSLAFLEPHQGDPSNWPKKDLDLSNDKRRATVARTGQNLFRMAAWGFEERDYEKAAEEWGDVGRAGVDLWPTRYVH